MYDSFRTDEHMARCYSIHELCGIEFKGDNNLEALRNEWEDKIANLAEPQTDQQLARILLEILKKSTKLKEDIQKYRRYKDGHKRKTLRFLTSALDRQIAQDQQDRNAAVLLKGGKPAAPGRKKVCKAWMKGT